MSPDLFNEMLDDAREMDSQAIADAAVAMDGLSTISKLALEQLQLEIEVENLEAALGEKKEKLKFIQETKLPQAMQSAGVNKFVTSEGFKIEVKPYYSAAIREDNQEACFAWLKNSGNDDIIKNEVKASFGRGEDEKAQLAIDALHTLGFDCTNKKSVHPQTLSAFVREQVESGNPNFPLDTFKVFIGQKAKITRSKR